MLRKLEFEQNKGRVFEKPDETIKAIITRKRKTTPTS